jgi:cellulose synthase/poly-beta-1,6-N-acetylglucosamine synthase-like glycosyltransferase
MKDGISFVVPVHNGARCVEEALDALAVEAAGFSETSGRPFEIIVIDDSSRDESMAILRRLARVHGFRLIDGEGLGAAAAINAGIRAARFPLIAQVDQDVVLEPGWVGTLAAELDDPDVGAAQGCYVADPEATLFARAMSFDLAQRYEAIGGGDTDHVCTGNSIYRTEALHLVGPFDESLGYGYDNDVSYRLRAAGYRLRFCHEARSVHRWREGLAGYLTQQYGFGYGRVDVVAKHPSRFAGDAVSPAAMMWHPLVLGIALVFLALALTAWESGGPSQGLAVSGAVLGGVLLFERVVAGIRAARRFRNATPLLFPFLHLLRDAAWVAAIVIWMARAVGGRPGRPSHSMRPRPESGS